MKKTITIEKEVYECILRNSVKVADLEAENMQLRQFCEEFNALNVAEENQKLKELLKECYKMLAQYHIENSEPTLGENIQLLTKIDEALK